MKLADWLFMQSLTPGQLRRMLGVDRATVHRYLVNKRVPRPDLLNEIERITGGRVTLADFRDPSLPHCAVVVNDNEGGERTLLPWSPEYELAVEGRHQSTRLAAPVQRAIYALDGRAWFTPSGTYLLDGRISDPRRIVAKANEVLRQQGKPLICYPGVHPLPDPPRADLAPQAGRKEAGDDTE